MSALVQVMTLHWRHNDHDGVSNHQPHGCLLNHLFRRRSKKTSKLRVNGLCAGNSPVPASYAENVSIWWRHHGISADRRHAIIWPNNDPVHRRIYAWPSLKELKFNVILLRFISYIWNNFRSFNVFEIYHNKRVNRTNISTFVNKIWTIGIIKTETQNVWSHWFIKLDRLINE